MAVKSALGFSENAACARCRKNNPHYRHITCSKVLHGMRKLPPSPNKFAAKPSRALPRQHSSWLARAGSSRSLSSQNVLSALNPVLQVPEVHKRSKVLSGLNPQTSKSSLGSQSGPPNVPSVLNPVLQNVPSALNPALQVPYVHTRSLKVPSVLNPVLQVP